MARWFLIDNQAVDWSDREEDPPAGALALMRPPKDDEKLVGKSWVVDPAAKADRIRRRARDPDALIARIEALETKCAELEQRLPAKALNT